jgi:predicted DNA-binding protein (UPF0251 family)/AcrR family transcriptional regulator
MTGTKRTPPDSFTSALEAIDNLAVQDLQKIQSDGQMAALMAHSKIGEVPVNSKSAAFYRHFGPVRNAYLEALVEIYRRCFKLALAHPRETGPDADEWARAQLQLAVGAVLEWIRHWYVFACEGAPSVSGPELPPPESWRAPAWLFGISLAFFGIGLMKDKHIPAMDSEERLGASHTRLLLKGARRVFLWELGSAIERVWNEETVAAGAIPAHTVTDQEQESKGRKRSKRRPSGFEGLGPKVNDYSRYLHDLTEKQHMAISLRLEYRLGLEEIASRMGVNRKTAYEHIATATRKIDQTQSNEKRKAHHPKSTPEQ